MSELCKECGAPVRDHVLGGPAPYHPNPVATRPPSLVDREAARAKAARAIYARQYHLAPEHADRMFQWYTEKPEGTDRSRVAIFSAFKDADAAIDAILSLVHPKDEVIHHTTEQSSTPIGHQK